MADNEKEFEDLHKIKEADTMQAVLDSLDKEVELLDFTEKKEREEAEVDAIFELIDSAVKIEREYELEKKRGKILSVDCPYEKIIEIYEDAMRRFEKINWKEQSLHLNDSITFYNDKIEKDKILRELARKKLES